MDIVTFFWNILIFCWDILTAFWQAFKNDQNAVTAVTALATVITVVIAYFVNKWLKHSAEVQYVSTLLTAFQDEWHDRTSVLMRAALQHDAFKEALNSGINGAYGQPIKYWEVSKLLNDKSLTGKASHSDRLHAFEDALHSLRFKDSLEGKLLFSGYEAIYRVILSFDRVAILRNERTAMRNFIQAYRPPIRDFAGILQAFIAVRILLREPDIEKNYKKDYMQLLNMLGLADPVLYKRCKEGLRNRREWPQLDWWRARTRWAYKRKQGSAKGCGGGADLPEKPR